ncbi:hypothetical protein RQP54_17835 [Curvibacter sp. APW13]|uniref:SprT-like domain-containing protein n=1 Tax=Curvibacter sp. APW13 TaxID=3077236 RepID=UPI0028E08237|nr:SprT-like domain-containing protein [Curvibacter sp. APW13]MDT8992738.1 hypothetical protein [Curvibacter sp. APW13]
MVTALEPEDDLEVGENPSAELRPNDDPTGELYPEFQQAYRFFNQRLFDGQLPYVLITLQRKHSSEAYWSPSRFAAVSGKLTGELAMNPRYLAVRSPIEILSFLVHEQVHVWQTYFGKASRRGYHNRQWADKMKEVGLYPSSTATVGGEETGEHMGHYIIDGGAFEIAAKELIDSGFEFTWYDRFPAHPASPIGRSSDIPIAKPTTPSTPQESVSQVDETATTVATTEAQVAPHSEQPQGSAVSTASVSAVLQRPREAQTPATMYPGLQIQLPSASESATRNRYRFQCPQCKQNAWGKKGLAISCTPCQEPMRADL